MLSDSFKCAFVSTNQRPTSPGEYLMCRFIVGGVMGAEIAEPARRPVLTCRGGNPAMANTEASEVRSGMFAPPQCPADWLMVGRGGLGVGGMKILRGQGLTAYMWNTRLRGRASRSWETSQLDFEPWRQNFEANTGGKLPNHVLHLSPLSQIPLRMFEQTAPLSWRLQRRVYAGV